MPALGERDAVRAVAAGEVGLEHVALPRRRLLAQRDPRRGVAVGDVAGEPVPERAGAQLDAVARRGARVVALDQVAGRVAHLDPARVAAHVVAADHGVRHAGQGDPAVGHLPHRIADDAVGPREVDADARVAGPREDVALDAVAVRALADLEAAVARVSHHVPEQRVAVGVGELDAQVAAALAGDDVALEPIPARVVHEEVRAGVAREGQTAHLGAGGAGEERDPAAIAADVEVAHRVPLASRARRARELDRRDLVALDAQIVHRPGVRAVLQLDPVVPLADHAVADRDAAVAVVADAGAEPDPVDDTAAEVDDDPVRADHQAVCSEAVEQVVGDPDRPRDLLPAADGLGLARLRRRRRRTGEQRLEAEGQLRRRLALLAAVELRAAAVRAVLGCVAHDEPVVRSPVEHGLHLTGHVPGQVPLAGVAGPRRPRRWPAGCPRSHRPRTRHPRGGAPRARHPRRRRGSTGAAWPSRARSRRGCRTAARSARACAS